MRQIWHAQEPRGARVVHVTRAADGYYPFGKFRQGDRRADATRGDHPCCFRNGAKLDIPGIVRLAHAKAQGAPRLLPIGRVARHRRKISGVDFAAGGMLKYLLGTAGIAFLYVRDSFIRSLVPTNSGWFAQAEIAAMDITANRPAPMRAI